MTLKNASIINMNSSVNFMIHTGPNLISVLRIMKPAEPIFFLKPQSLYNNNSKWSYTWGSPLCFLLILLLRIIHFNNESSFSSLRTTPIHLIWIIPTVLQGMFFYSFANEMLKFRNIDFLTQVHRPNKQQS